MKRNIKSPRERYGERVRADCFRPGVTSAYIAKKSGINAATIRTWKADPGKMPAYRYLQILEALEE